MTIYGAQNSAEFTVDPKTIDVIDKKQMYNSVITRKENDSKDWNCIISMFLTSFNVYFVFGYAFVCVYVLNCYLTFSGFFETRFGFFW